MTAADPILKAAAQREAEDIVANTSGVVACVIASTDGFDLASTTTRGVDAARVAAMASSISAIGDVVTQEARLGRSRSVTVNTEDGFAFFCAAHRRDRELIVNVIADKSAILAQVVRRAQDCAKTLEAL